MNKHTTQKGFTILIATLVSSIVIAIGLSLMSVMLKQLQLAGVARESSIAFQAANAGVECIRFYDISTTYGDTFDVPGNGGSQGSAATITCLSGNATNSEGPAASGDEQRFQWTWASGEVCTDVSIYKFHNTSSAQPVVVNGETIRGDCPAGVECTVVKSRGYNASCSDLSGSRTVERELTVVY